MASFRNPPCTPRSSAASRRVPSALAALGLFFACHSDVGGPAGSLDAGGAGRPQGGAPPLASGGASGEAGQGGDSGSTDAVCGDGVRTGTEECDDANTQGGDGCDANCRIEATDGACGDGQTDGGEECDDGNLQPGDGCDARCRLEECGNARLDAGEECDPPREGVCTMRCVRVGQSCADGRVQASEFEECDDGNDTPGDGCHECRHECGDGRIDRTIGEECEPEYSDRCSDQCRWLPTCGDGEVQPGAGEECDPSNGVTCVACKAVEPEPASCSGGAGGVMAAGQGGECSRPPECVPQNDAQLLSNGTFDTNFAGWTTQTTSVQLRTIDDGFPDPLALEVSFDPGSVRALSGAHQCIPVQPGARYEFRGHYRIPAGVPEGVAANVTAFLYRGTQCSGSIVQPPSSGPAGSVRDDWTPYQLSVDTGALAGESTDARLLVRLNVVRPAEVSGSRVLWDDVSLSEREAKCGDCTIDPGETCDDGNRTAGDGCGPSCQLEICGNGALEGGEQCDDGNTVFGAEDDLCTPGCRTASPCDDCAVLACSAPLAACFGLPGTALSGPKASTARSTLCDELRACVQRSACDRVSRTTAGVTGAFLENCYCGSAGDGCFDGSNLANGRCRAEVEAALETSDPQTLLARFGGAYVDYPIFDALGELLACELANCGPACVAPPSCGDGRLQDRDLDFTFVVDRQEVECLDELTHTGRGCSFEECDDGNLEPGDGCDANCFVEACGNYVVQSGEGCDDGNLESGDGCSAECQPEFDCGNSVVEPPFEECDPPESGAGRVCSGAEYENDPSQCGCDASCARTVCGNGVVQRPAEQCDPPDAISCSDDCLFLDQSPCELCINASPDLGPVNEEYCNADAACVAVKQCVLAADCYSPIPARCYCGDNLEECETPTFVPDGPCVEVIRAGLGTDNPNNAMVLERYFAFEYPGGVAMSVVDEATRQCESECFP